MKNLLTTKISYQAMTKSRLHSLIKKGKEKQTPYHKIIPIIEEFAIMSNVAGVDMNGIPQQS
jgi:hypothetical protein